MAIFNSYVKLPEGNNQCRERPKNAGVHMFAIFSYYVLQRKSLPDFTGPVVWAPCCKHFWDVPRRADLNPKLGS